MGCPAAACQRILSAKIQQIMQFCDKCDLGGSQREELGNEAECLKVGKSGVEKRGIKGGALGSKGVGMKQRERRSEGSEGKEDGVEMILRK